MDAGILPVKRLQTAKQRLAPHFTKHQRERIADALLQDALALCQSADFLTWWVVSDDEKVLRSAESRGFRAVRDPGRGLNAAIAVAIETAKAQGAASVAMIPCDVPLAFRGDLVDLLDTGATSDIVVVPSERDGGTNALYMSPPDLLPPSFGPGSLQRHIAVAEQSCLRCALLSLPRLALDLDTVDDIREFLAKPVLGHSYTRELLEELPIPATD